MKEQEGKPRSPYMCIPNAIIRKRQSRGVAISAKLRRCFDRIQQVRTISSTKKTARVSGPFSHSTGPKFKVTIATCPDSLQNKGQQRPCSSFGGDLHCPSPQAGPDTAGETDYSIGY